MVRNGDIRSFFSKAPPRPQASTPSAPRSHQASPQASQAHTPQTVPPFSPASPGPSSLPTTPKTPCASRSDPRGPVSKTAVIAGSDEEDGLSDSEDDDLPSLENMFKPKANDVPSVPSSMRKANPFATPKTKRQAVIDFTTPVSIRTKPSHKFDMKALMRDAEIDERTEALRDSANTVEESESKPVKLKGAAEVRKNLVHLAVGDEDDELGQKALRAMEKQEAASTKTTWYFFKPVIDNSAPQAQDRPYPKTKDNAVWDMILSDPTLREQHLLSGIAKTFMMNQHLPDELFVWMLDQLVCDPSPTCRREYTHILALTQPSQKQRLLNTSSLKGLFQQLGASKDLDHFSEVTPVPEVPGAYSKHDWSRLLSVLRLLSIPEISKNMGFDTIITAARILIFMAVDKTLMDTVEVAVEFQNAIQMLATSCPISKWPDFCDDIAQSLFKALSRPTQQLQPLLCLPTSEPRLHELRVRLASVFFFSDPCWATATNYTSFIPSVTERLSSPVFNIGAPETDFVDADAQFRLLDMVLDHSSSSIFRLRFPEGPPDDYDREVDVLHAKVEDMWRSIKGGGVSYISRMEAKNTLMWIKDRIPYTVRTRPLTKKSIYQEDQGVMRDPLRQKSLKMWVRKKDGSAEVAAVE